MNLGLPEESKAKKKKKKKVEKGIVTKKGISAISMVSKTANNLT